jgi:hypothetical protein
VITAGCALTRVEGLHGCHCVDQGQDHAPIDVRDAVADLSELIRALF